MHKEVTFLAPLNIRLVHNIIFLVFGRLRITTVDVHFSHVFYDFVYTHKIKHDWGMAFAQIFCSYYFLVFQNVTSFFFRWKNFTPLNSSMFGLWAATVLCLAVSRDFNDTRYASKRWRHVFWIRPTCGIGSFACSCHALSRWRHSALFPWRQVIRAPSNPMPCEATLL